MLSKQGRELLAVNPRQKKPDDWSFKMIRQGLALLLEAT